MCWTRSERYRAWSTSGRRRSTTSVATSSFRTRGSGDGTEFDTAAVRRRTRVGVGWTTPSGRVQRNYHRHDSRREQGTGRPLSARRRPRYGFYTSGAGNANVRRVTAASFPRYGFDPHASDLTPSRNIVIEPVEQPTTDATGSLLQGWKQEQFAAVSDTRTTDTGQISQMRKDGISRSETSSAIGTVRAV